jgi:hypothetical protein
MLGWTLLFALLALLCAMFTLLNGLGDGFSSVKLATLVFSGLFITCVATRFVGRRA